MSVRVKVLERNRKGRWLSYYPAIKALLKADLKNLSDLDKANMQKNFMEVAMLISTYMFIAMLKGLKDSLDDDEEDKLLFKTANFLINSGNRLLDDIYFYLVLTPSTVNILRNPVPAISLIDDLGEWFDAVVRYINDDDIIKTGVNSGKSRLNRETLQLFPLLKQIPNMENVTSKDLSNPKKKEPETDTEYLERKRKNKRKDRKKKERRDD